MSNSNSGPIPALLVAAPDVAVIIVTYKSPG